MNPDSWNALGPGTRWLLSFLVCSWSVISSGSQPDTKFSARLWQMEEGLPHNIVQAITQTHDGNLWVGTREGLARFDGVHFTTIEFPGRITHPSISALNVGSEGSLWIGTENAGFFCLKNGKLLSRSLWDGSRECIALDIQVDNVGTVWVGTDGGLMQINKEKTEFQKGIRLAVSVCVDPDGSIWIAGEGVKHLKDGKITDYIPREGNVPSPRRIYRDHKSIYWIGSTGGLTRIQGDTATYYKKGDGPPGIVSIIFEDRERNLWIGCYGGLSRFAEGKFISENGGASYRVYAIFEDREGNLWTGSEEGLTRLTPNLFKTYTKKDGLTQNMIISTCSSRDGSVWIAAWGGGLYHLKEGAISIFNRTNGLSSDFILAIHEGRDGNLWVGLDYGSGLDQMKDGKVVHYSANDGLVGGAITAISEDLQGNVWLGTRDALNRFKNGKFTSYTTRDGLSHNKVNALCEGWGGNLWIGTDKGLTLRRNDHFIGLPATASKLTEPVLSLYEDGEHTLWIGTRNTGLGRLKEGKLDLYTSRQGLFSDSIYSILEDDKGNLWMNSSKGIFRVGKKEFNDVSSGIVSSLTSVSYSRTDGIISSAQYREVTQPAACRTTDGRLWFRTTQGIATIDPNEITTNPTPPEVMIEQVIADKKKIEGERPKEEAKRISSAGVPWSFAALPASAVRIPPGGGELEIHYTALSFRAPEKIRFKYKLEGVDSDWMNARDRRVAYYNNIAPGHYVFRVIACNSDGIWNMKGATIALIFQPHLWQTKWFLSIGVLMVVAAITGTVRQITRRKMQRKLERMEQQHAIEKERARIARDIHDDLGARVTQITLLSELSNEEDARELWANMRKIAAKSREMAQSLDEIVWAVNPEHDTLESLFEYLSQSADEFLEETNIRLRLNMPRRVPSAKISAEIRHQLFLVVREALNNAVKHADATEIRIDFIFAEDRLHVAILDNGNGFEANSQLRGGNGLKNMRGRLEGVGGQFEILSRRGEGTKIRMTVGLKIPHDCVDRN
ncbi:MAG: putative two-component system sensor kinase [Pedosphaera sp.]|nr:putative two-component system sensor kinase [Pedosphaera sp.]